MTTPGLQIQELETIYDEMAQHIDQAGEKSELFLAKLCMLLANRVADKEVVIGLMASASQDL